jgi:lipopolysaccharide/colanic/teichoic acid biosynthesis glycosyltransferase
VIAGARLHAAGTAAGPRAASAARRDRVKRGLDVLLGGAALVAALPLIAAAAAAVVLGSGRPAFHRGRAVGRGGRPFVIFKLRTMAAGAPDGEFRDYLARWVRGEARMQEEGGERLYKLAADPRVTRVGRVLRRWSLDELPQLLNVLKGEMSLVGPRPPLEAEYALYGPRERGRLAVRPGITGLAQVEARGRLSFEETLALDLDYVRRWSLPLDIAILARTAAVVVAGRGAR